MKRVILFCQAPIDLGYCLEIYEKNKNHARVSIFVINVEGCFLFFKNINIQLENLIFIPYEKCFSFKNPFLLFKERQRLRNIYKMYFLDKKNCDIYFFYTVFDWITSYFVTRLSIDNEVVFIGKDNPSDQTNIKSYSISSLFSIFLLFIITGIRFHYIKHHIRKILNFNYKKYKIKRDDHINIHLGIYDKYAYSINTTFNKIVLFENKQLGNNVFVNYDEVLKSILDILTENNKILVKPHPRLGYSDLLNNYEFEVIPAFIPGEFLDLRNTRFVVGIETTAIAKFSKSMKNKTLCLLNLFKFISEEKKIYCINHLNELSNGNIIYIDTLEELNHMVNKENYQHI